LHTALQKIVFNQLFCLPEHDSTMVDIVFHKYIRTARITAQQSGTGRQASNCGVFGDGIVNSGMNI